MKVYDGGCNSLSIQNSDPNALRKVTQVPVRSAFRSSSGFSSTWVLLWVKC